MSKQATLAERQKRMKNFINGLRERGDEKTAIFLEQIYTCRFERVRVLLKVSRNKKTIHSGGSLIVERTGRGG